LKDGFTWSQCWNRIGPFELSPTTHMSQGLSAILMCEPPWFWPNQKRPARNDPWTMHIYPTPTVCDRLQAARIQLCVENTEVLSFEVHQHSCWRCISEPRLGPKARWNIFFSFCWNWLLLLRIYPCFPCEKHEIDQHQRYSDQFLDYSATLHPNDERTQRLPINKLGVVFWKMDPLDHNAETGLDLFDKVQRHT
jgi:hypothetical protein